LAADWAGFAIACALAVLGVLLVAVHWLVGFALILAAVVIGVGAIRYILHRAAVKRRYPPPGTFVDLGGYQIHLIAQGSGPAVVWLGGAHSGGYVMRHLHELATDEFRSILIDRPGTGWSDVGPFPRSTAREAQEVMQALESAGETGPFIFAGHSFGGLLAANIARRNPSTTAGVILIDATPPDTIIYGPRLSSLRTMQTTMLKSAARRMMGLGLRPEKTPEHPVLQQYAKVLGEHQVAGNALETSVGNALANWSIFRELTPTGFADVAWETIVYDDDLGDMPVAVVFPGDPIDSDDNEIGLLPEYARADETEKKRMRSFFARNRRRYLVSSSKARWVAAPAGSGHNFPYFHPDIVIGALRSIAEEAGLRPGSVDAPGRVREGGVHAQG
jgi:pimeloyl-ACP methyl ester carboxylesterase